jgi:Uma2 family endonuclease
MPAAAPLTADDLLRVQIPGKATELVRGVLVVKEPPGFLHGAVAARLAKAVMDHVDARNLGLVLAAETGFKLASDPDTVRAPDVAFVRRERVPDPLPCWGAWLHSRLAAPPRYVSITRGQSGSGA